MFMGGFWRRLWLGRGERGGEGGLREVGQFFEYLLAFKSFSSILLFTLSYVHVPNEGNYFLPDPELVLQLSKPLEIITAKHYLDVATLW